MTTEKTASFLVDLDSNAAEVAKEGADELEKLRAKIEGATEKVRNWGAANRALKGSSDEVVKAQGELIEKIQAQRGVISEANVALLKMGASYGKLSADVKKAEAAKAKMMAQEQADAVKQLATAQKLEAEEKKKQKLKEAEDLKKITEAQGKLTKGLKLAGGPAHDLAERFKSLKEAVGGAGTGMGALGFGVGLAVAGVVALTTAVAVATLKIASFILESANAMRSLGLMRESMTGSADSGKALGTWVDYLGHRVKLTREELTDLALANDKAFSPARTTVNPRKMGQVVQEITYAMAQAKAGMGKFGDEASSKLREIVERGKVWGRTRVTPEDLEGTGLKFAEVAAAYAKLNKIPIDTARKNLQGYSADVLGVAKAIHAAADTRWARTNAEGLLDLDVQWAKFKERLVSLAGSGVLEPLLKDLSKLAYAFDPASASGKRLQATFEKIGTAIGNIDIGAVTKDIESGIAWVNDFVDSLVDVTATFKTIANDPTVGIMITGFKVLGYTVAAVAGVIIVTLAGAGIVIGLVWKAFELLGEGIYALYAGIVGIQWGKVWDTIKSPFVAAWNWLTGIHWSDIGTSIIDGIVDGITGAAGKLWDVVTGVGNKIKTTFKGLLGIASPSKVFEGYGVQTTAGYARGIEKGSLDTRSAVASMAPSSPAPMSPAGGGQGAGTMNVLNVTFEVHADGARGADVVKAIKESSILADLQKAVRRMLITQGIPTQAEVS
jgi:hypothetical protein